jgi:hypothetical protein
MRRCSADVGMPATAPRQHVSLIPFLRKARCDGCDIHKAKIITVSSLYAIAIAANGVAMGMLGWQY